MGLEVNFETNGDILMGNTAVPSLGAGSYPIGQWFEFKFEIDLSSNNWELFIDGVSQGLFQILKISFLQLTTILELEMSTI